ncbi:MAG TPA: murein biosynthesis integral membrane protein MurJ [Steroidobacteraceae bacterium]|jgi:putative peptidoglycan lipid II flippase|nr:murein biosynthesis integral membrane protein MurJ [Steroidobacteraceae bacterium]
MSVRSPPEAPAGGAATDAVMPADGTATTGSAAMAGDVASREARAERLNTRAAGVIALAVMCSRVLGLARDQVSAALFGGGGVMDAFTIAFRIPNLLRDLFAEGALSTAFVTTFSKTIARGGNEAAWRLANKVATMTAVALSLICVAGIVFSPQIVAGLAPGFAPAKAALTVSLTRVMFPFILLVSMAALVMGMLNARNVFGIPAIASSFFNIGSIVGGVLLGYWLDPHFGPRALLGFAIGTLIGGALQLGVQLPALGGLGYRFRPDFRWRDPGVSAILALMGPSVIAASTTQLNVFINSIFASTLGNGPVFWLSIAFRVMQLPLGLFGVALGTVTLPLLSRLVAAGNLPAFRAELSRGMRLAFLLTLPATVGLMVLAGPIISVLYQHGRLNAYEADQAAGALQFYAVGLCGYAALKVLVNAFYALDRRKTPMVVSFIAVALNLLFNWIFTFRLGWGTQGLAFSTGCVASCNFLVLYWLMRQQLARLETRRMVQMLAKVAAACVVLALICWAARHWLLAQWATQPFLPKLGLLCATIVAGLLGFVGCGLALRIEELQELSAALRRRLQRAG